MKHGIITPTGSDTVLTGIVAPTSPTDLTLAALVASIFDSDGASVKRLLCVDYMARKVGSKESVTNDFSTLESTVNGLTGRVAKKWLIPSDETKTSTEWDLQNASLASLLTPLDSVPTRGDFDDEIDAILGFRQSSRSWQGLVGAIEDANLALLARGTPVEIQPVLFIDQLTSNVLLFEFDASPAHNFAGTTVCGVTWTSKFAQSVQASGSGGLFAL